MNKIWNQIHWTRTVQRYESNNFLKFARARFFEHFFHADGFKLEYRCRIGIGKDQVGIFVV